MAPYFLFVEPKKVIENYRTEGGNNDQVFISQTETQLCCEADCKSHNNDAICFFGLKNDKIYFFCSLQYK